MRSAVEASEGRGKKLRPIADAVAVMLERKFGVPATYELERKFDWVTTCPSADSLGGVWTDLSVVYSSLVDEAFSLDDRVLLPRERGEAGNQKIDIWFDAPYSFALEYDERQHFTQFRERGLRYYLETGYDSLPFDLEGYLAACRPKKPGKSGWQRVRAPDPLFPPMLPGEAQDNRLRQRAFRDTVKDLAPFCLAGVHGTRRVGAYVVGWKRSGFTEADCATICEHLRLYGRLDEFQVD